MERSALNDRESESGGDKAKLRRLRILARQLSDIDVYGSVVTGTEPHSSPLSEYLSKEQHAHFGNKIDTLRPLFLKNIAFLEKCLATQELRRDVIDVCYELVTLNAVGPHIAAFVAQHADVFADEVRVFSSETDKVLQIFVESYAILGGEFEDPVDNNDRARLRHTARRISESIHLYFSEANMPSSEQLKSHLDRLVTAGSLLCQLDAGEREWFADTCAHYVVSAVLTDTYQGHYGFRESINDLAKNLAQKKPITLAKPITKLDIGHMLHNLGPEMADRVMRKVFDRVGLGKEMLDELLHNENPVMYADGSTKLTVEIVTRAFDQLADIHLLEKSRPGSVAFFRNELGVRWLSRYPTEMLIDQYDQRNNNTTPYGIVITALFDWNESFFEELDRDALYHAWKVLKQNGMCLRIAEVNSKRELAHVVANCKSQYGKGTLKCALLRAHASKRHLELGPDTVDGDIDMGDVEKEEFSSLLSVIDANGSIVLDGCGLGRRSGFAEKVSAHFQGKVFAPKNMESSLSDLGITVTNGEIVFQPLYRTGKTDTEARLFKGGRVRK